MSGLEINIESDLSGAQEVFAELLRRSVDQTELFVSIRAVLGDTWQRAFAEQADPSNGAPWAPLSPSTQGRIVNGAPRGPDHKLRVTDLLFDSGETRSGPDFAEIGTALPGYPSYLQTGTSRMPARPFVGFGDQDAVAVTDLALQFLADGAAFAVSP